MDCSEECDDDEDECEEEEDVEEEVVEVAHQHQEQEPIFAELFERCRLISENQPVYTVNTTSGIYTVDSITAPIRNYPI